MNLSPEQIQKNWEIFLKVIETYISEPRKEKLLSFYKQLEERIALMPASTKKSYHNCFPGGYVDHVLRVVSASLKLSRVWIEMGIKENYSQEELVFSALNHDLGKIGDMENEAYLPNDSQWHIDKLGEIYKHNTKLSFMSVPDRSLFLLMENNIKYSQNEFLAIKLHDGLYEEANKSYYMGYLPETKLRTSLPYIIHQADLLAARVEFEREGLLEILNK